MFILLQKTKNTESPHAPPGNPAGNFPLLQKEKGRDLMLAPGPILGKACGASSHSSPPFTPVCTRLSWSQGTRIPQDSPHFLRAALPLGAACLLRSFFKDKVSQQYTVLIYEISRSFAWTLKTSQRKSVSGHLIPKGWEETGLGVSLLSCTFLSLLRGVLPSFPIYIGRVVPTDSLADLYYLCKNFVSRGLAAGPSYKGLGLLLWCC